MRCIAFLVILASVLGCKQNTEIQSFRDQFRWLSGKWQGQNGSVILSEQWHWNKTRFEGEGYEVENGDTIFSEKIFLQPLDGMPAYVVSIPFQGLILYTGQKDEKGRWMFENKEHGFPSRIFYVQESDSAIIISLEARGDSFRGEHSYQLKRVN